MNDEILILEKILSQLANVMNVIPGEVFRMKESETILILQRRMEKSDLQQARISLISATKVTLIHALGILGVTAPERM